MPKINIYLPDDLAESVKEAGIPVSAVCQRALEQAVRRVTALRETAMGDLEGGDPTARLTHFTPRAKATLKLSVERSRAAGAPGIGTEHLLGAILAEGANLALHVLRAIDIEPEQVERDLASRRPAPGPGDGAMTPDTEPEPGGGDPVKPAREVSPGDAPGEGGAVRAGGGARHFNADAANALELAVTEATALGHNYIGCEHLLLGLVAEPDGMGGKVLRGMGAEMRLTRRAVVAALAGYVHLRAQGSAPAAAPAGDTAQALAAAVRQELRPLLTRIERLERQAGPPPGGPPNRP